MYRIHFWLACFSFGQKSYFLIGYSPFLIGWFYYTWSISDWLEFYLQGLSFSDWLALVWIYRIGVDYLTLLHYRVCFLIGRCYCWFTVLILIGWLYYTGYASSDWLALLLEYVSFDWLALLSRMIRIGWLEGWELPIFFVQGLFVIIWPKLQGHSLFGLL